MSGPPDKQLIASAAGGSREAFAALAAQFRDRLFRFLLLRCGNRADAEDATQEALLAAWRHLPSYDARWQFSTWLYRIALRKLPRRKRSTVPLAEELPGHDNPVARAERDNLWRLATRELSGDAVSALWLYYGEGLTTRETAEALSRTVAWVKVSLLRSRRRLAAVIDGDES